MFLTKTIRSGFMAGVALTSLFTACMPENQYNHARLDEEVTVAMDSYGGQSAFTFPEASSLISIPQDPLNPLTPEKVALGKLLYHETAMGTQPKEESNMHTYSCASCHHVQAGFQANLPQGLGEGGIGFGNFGEGRRIAPGFPEDSVDKQPIRTPSVLGIAYQPNVLWNGQFGATDHNKGTESLWPDGTPIAVNRLGFQGTEVQAIAGMGVHRLAIDSSWVMEYGYDQMFLEAYPSLEPEECFTNEMAGLAIAAYERTILPNQSPFQRWLRGESDAMTVSQKEGALLFFGEAGCANCHNGPALTDGDFHVAGMSGLSNVPVEDGANLGRGGFTKDDADNYKFKTPQLYNLLDSRLYGHGATFTSVEDVIEYHLSGDIQDSRITFSMMDPYLQINQVRLSNREMSTLVDFVENALYDPNLSRYVPTALNSGMCFPVADNTAKTDLDCQ